MKPRPAALLLFSSVSILAPSAVYAVIINPDIPGTYTRDDGFVGLIANLYQFSLIVGGLLAFGAIVYAAARYTASGGNTAIQSDARDRITQALLGLLLLLGASIILLTFNPGFFTGGSGGIEFSIPDLQLPEDVAPPPPSYGWSETWL